MVSFPLLNKRFSDKFSNFVTKGKLLSFIFCSSSSRRFFSFEESFRLSLFSSVLLLYTSFIFPLEKENTSFTTFLTATSLSFSSINLFNPLSDSDSLSESSILKESFSVSLILYINLNIYAIYLCFDFIIFFDFLQSLYHYIFE